MNWKYRPINGWTKAKIIAQLREKMPKDGSRAGLTITILGNVSAFRCAYRAPNGCCVVGAFIPDDEYSQTFEGVNLDSPRMSHVRKFMPLPGNVMNTLQNVHDNTLDKESAVERCVGWVESCVEDK